MERLQAFLPSLLMIAFIAGATRLYLWWAIRHFGDNWKSIEWHSQNKWKVIWTVGTPAAYVLAPTAEELIFRAPLVIIFDSMSSLAWCGVIASAALFALLHWFGDHVAMPTLISERELGNHQSDDLTEETTRLKTERGGLVLMHKLLQIFCAFPMGVLAGYLAITYQSAWVAVGLHSLCNVLLPVVLPIIVGVGILVLYLVNEVEGWLWRRRRRRRQPRRR